MNGTIDHNIQEKELLKKSGFVVNTNLGKKIATLATKAEKK